MGTKAGRRLSARKNVRHVHGDQSLAPGGLGDFFFFRMARAGSISPVVSRPTSTPRGRRDVAGRIGDCTGGAEECMAGDPWTILGPDAI